MKFSNCFTASSVRIFCSIVIIMQYHVQPSCESPQIGGYTSDESMNKGLDSSFGQLPLWLMRLFILSPATTSGDFMWLLIWLFGFLAEVWGMNLFCSLYSGMDSEFDDDDDVICAHTYKCDDERTSARTFDPSEYSNFKLPLYPSRASSLSSIFITFRA